MAILSGHKLFLEFCFWMTHINWHPSCWDSGQISKHSLTGRFGYGFDH